jgi:GNAT superfamily N-acetyltransferase
MQDNRSLSFKRLELHRGYEPGAIGRIGELHGRFYAEAWGVGAAFEIQVVRQLSDFIERYDPTKDLLLSVHAGNVMGGSLVIIGPRQRNADRAQLRFFIVAQEFRGLEAGKLMLSTALDWCRERAFREVFLWTVDHLAESRRLYEKAGFQVVERVRDDRYSLPLENLKMELSLNPNSKSISTLNLG